MRDITCLAILLCGIAVAGCKRHNSATDARPPSESRNLQRASPESTTRPPTVTVDGITVDARVVPVYTYVKALQTGDLALYKSACSTHVVKYLFTEIEDAFEKQRKDFKNRYGKLDAKEFQYEYRFEDGSPFPMAYYSHSGRGSGFYVEEEGGAWKISITPKDVKRFKEKAASSAEPSDGSGRDAAE